MSSLFWCFDPETSRALGGFSDVVYHEIDDEQHGSAGIVCTHVKRPEWGVLIAAAPGMLTTLKAISKALEDINVFDADYEGGSERFRELVRLNEEQEAVLQLARDAILKAEGVK